MSHALDGPVETVHQLVGRKRGSSNAAVVGRRGSKERTPAENPAEAARPVEADNLPAAALLPGPSAGEALQPLHDSLAPASVQLGDPAAAASPSASLSRGGRRAGRQKHPAPHEAYGRGHEATSSSGNSWADVPSSTHLQGRAGVGRDEVPAEAPAAPAAQPLQQQQAGFQVPQVGDLLCVSCRAVGGVDTLLSLVRR